MKNIIIISFVILILTGCYKQDSELVEKDKIIRVCNKLFIETDKKNWKEVSSQFANTVLFDMSSLGGGQAENVSPSKIVEGWENGLKSIQFIHHQVGNYLVNLNDNGADVFCYGIASHYKQNPTNNNVRTFVGSYNIHLVYLENNWKIDKLKFNLKYIDGNKDL